MLFYFCKLTCEYPLCGDWLHPRWLHSNGNWTKYEEEIWEEKLRKSKWKSGGFQLFPHQVETVFFCKCFNLLWKKTRPKSTFHCWIKSAAFYAHKEKIAASLGRILLRDTNYNLKRKHHQFTTAETSPTFFFFLKILLLWTFSVI